MQQAVDPASELFLQARGFGIDGRQVEAQHLAAAIEVSRIEQQIRIGVEQARAGAGRRNQPPEHRSDPFLDDRKIKVFVARQRRDALAGLQLQQFFRVDGDRIGVDRG
ncbi:hypothetical protein D3C72_2171230 [compost metagenome]